MKLVLLLITVTLIYAGSLTKYIKELNELNIEQRQVLYKVFARAKSDNLSWTAAAVAWEESKFGEWQIPLDIHGSLDCGIFHNNVPTLLKKYHMPNTMKNRSKVCSRLIYHSEWSYNEFKDNITYWKKLRHNDWSRVWIGYNGGFSNSKKSMAYSKRIAMRIKAIKIVYGNELLLYTNYSELHIDYLMKLN